MNNKGFALSGIIYGILIIFLLLIFSILSLMMVRGNTLFKIKENDFNTIKNNEDETVSMNEIIADFTKINVTSDANNHGEVDYNYNVYSPYNYEIRSSVSDGTITYSAYESDVLKTSITREIDLAASAKVDEFTYKKDYEKVLLNPGIYKLEAWSSNRLGGNYVSGYITLTNKKIIYIYAGANSKTGFNSGASHISYKIGELDKLSADDILIAASEDTISDKLTEVTTATDQNDGSGKIKITSLIYFTK